MKIPNRHINKPPKAPYKIPDKISTISPGINAIIFACIKLITLLISLKEPENQENFKNYIDYEH